MTTAGPQYPPPPPRTPEAAQAPRRGRTVWIVAGIIALVGIVVIAVMAGLTFLDIREDPTPPPTVSTGATPEPSASEPQGGSPTPTSAPTKDTWAGFPPPNVDDLPDLTDPQFPDRVLEYDLIHEDVDSFSVFADYNDAEAFVTLQVLLTTDHTDYARKVTSMQDPAWFGGTVCGHPRKLPDQLECVMAGRSETLEVGTASEDVTIEDLAVFTEALYDAL